MGEREADALDSEDVACGDAWIGDTSKVGESGPVRVCCGEKAEAAEGKDGGAERVDHSACCECFECLALPMPAPVAAAASSAISPAPASALGCVGTSAVEAGCRAWRALCERCGENTTGTRPAPLPPEAERLLSAARAAEAEASDGCACE